MSIRNTNKTPSDDKSDITPLSDVSPKVMKYFKARKSGKSKADSAREAGYADIVHTGRIEKSQTYQQIERRFSQVLLGRISMEDIADINVRNMKQDKDIGGSNQAVKIALDKLEAESRGHEDDDRMIVILKR